MRWDVFFGSFPTLLSALPVTLELAVISITLGFLLAVLLAAARLSGLRALAALAYAYVYVIRGTPLLAQVFFVYYGLGQLDAMRNSILWPVFREAYACALIALSLNTAAYGSEIIRGGLLSVPRGQIEAAKAFGLSPTQRFRHVVFPQALRAMLPAYGNELILMLKGTSLASTITIIELTGQARILASETYAPIEVFLAAGAIYLGLNVVLSFGVRLLEGRVQRSGGFAMEG
ncbi:MAG: ABC transporter permease subunit [Mesorhizobium sp.]|uniref:ABC transporter permease n=1 Tax=Mesorhizobium sp. TaxID=1871066 RepID=UPI001AC21BDC|nr:ABC transporter permease subunit [Mesorhizobium sp.]MBN9217304.1 ABC transporter permease subunit [Mesorhizobium sp.]